MKISVKNTANGNIAKFDVDFEARKLEIIDLPKDYVFDEFFEDLDYHHFER